MKLVSGEGIEWRNGEAKERQGYYIPWNGVPKVFKILIKKNYGTRLMEDEDGKQYVQRNPDSPIESAESVGDLEKYFEKCRDLFVEFGRQAMAYKPLRANVRHLKRNGYYASQTIDGIDAMTDKRNKNNPLLYIDEITGHAYRTEPKPMRRGVLKLLRVGDFVFVRDKNEPRPFQDWQIKADDMKYYIINRAFRK